MRISSAFILATCFIANSAAAADWPRWRGPANDGHVAPGDRALSNLPAQARVLWQAPAGEGLASPVVAAGKVIAFDNQGGRELLRALDAPTGRELWRADIDEPFSDSQGPTGPRNTPVIDGPRVYAVSCRGELQCRATADGKLIWRTRFTEDFGATFIGEKGSAQGAARHGNNASPLVDGDHLIVAVGGVEGAGVVCFEKATGKVVWKSTNDQAGYAPPVVATIQGVPQVLCYTADGIVGLRRSDGRELWRVPIKTAFARHVTTPIAVSNLVVVSSHEVGLMGIRVTRDTDTWSAETAWKSRDTAINFASPVAVQGFLFGLGPNRNLVCVEIATGRLAWTQDGVFVTSPSKAYGGFLVVGNRILVLTDTGELVLLDASPESYVEHARIQVCGSNWCNPAYSNGVLYLRDGFKSEGNWKAVQLAE